MANDAVLQRLYVEILAKTDGLEAALKDATSTAREAVKNMEAAAATAGQSVGTDLVAGFNVARESTGQFTREFTTSMQQAGMSTERIASEIGTLNAAMRQNHEAIRAGNISREEYRRVLSSQRDEMRDLMRAYNQAARGTTSFTDAQRKAGGESKELDETIKRLSNEVRTQRNLWAGRINDDEQFRASTERLHQEMRELSENTDLTGTQMRKLTGDMAYAQRGLDSVNNVASRGGLAWTAQIGIADALGGSLRSLGPAGNTAANGLRMMQNGFANLNGPLDLSNAGVQRLIGNVSRLALILPLIGAAGAAAAVAGLHRMAAASAQMATELEVAAHRTGLNVEALQEYHYAASTAGISAERFNTVAQRLLRRASDAQNGNRALADTFRGLGVDIEGADGKLRSADDILGQVADGLFSVENQGERVAAAFRLMDTDGSIMLNFLSAGSEGIAEMRKEARDLGLVISGEAIMSLSQYGNQVEQLRRQFEVLKVEISAAFLPVLQDHLMPFIEENVIPWLHSAANQVIEFADSFTEFGPAGTAFRQEMISNMRAVIEFGRTIGVVVNSAIAAFNAVASVGGAVGGFVGGLTDTAYIEDQRAIIQAQIDQIEAAVAAGNVAADEMHATLMGLHRDFAQVPWNAAVEGLGFGFNYFAENAGDAVKGAADLLNANLDETIAGWLEHAFNKETGTREARNFGKDLATNVSDGFTSGAAAATRTITSVITSMHEAMAIAAQRESHSIAVGMDEQAAAAIRLQEELQAAQGAYNALLTGSFDTAPSDELLLGIRTIIAELEAGMGAIQEGTPAYTSAWISKLQGQLAIGAANVEEVRSLLVEAREKVEVELHDLFQKSIFTGDEVDAVTARIGLVDQALASLPETAEAAGTGIVAAFQRAATAANEALNGITFEMPSIFAGIGDYAADNLAFEEAARLAQLLGQEFDPVAERLRIVENRIRDLNSSFYGLNPLQRMWLTNLQAEAAQLREQQAAVGRYTTAIRAAMTAINDVTVSVPAGLQRAAGAVTDLLSVTAGVRGDRIVANALGEDFDQLASEATHLQRVVTDLAERYDRLSLAERLLLAVTRARLQIVNADIAAREAQAEGALESERATLEAAQAAESAAASYSSLMAAIEGIGRTVDPIDAQRQALRELAATGLLTSAQVIAAIQAEGQARERLTAIIEEQEQAQARAAAESGFDDVARSIAEFTGTATSEFDDMRTSVMEWADQLITDMMDGTIRWEEYTKAAAEARLAMELIDAAELNNALRELASTVGGLGGDILNLTADLHRAIVAFGVTGEVLPLVTAGFNAATSAVQAFQRAFSDGFDGNELLSGLVGIGSGIATLIGGPAMGQAFAAIGGFVQTLLGDLSNGLAQIRAEVEGIASRSRYLGEAMIQSFADANTSRISRDGFLGWLGFTKAGMTAEGKAMFEELVRIAESTAGGVGRALASGTLDEFRTAMGDNLTKLIQDQMIDALMRTASMQSRMTAVTEAIAGGDPEEIRAAYAKLQHMAELGWKNIQAAIGDSGDTVRDYTNEIERARRATEGLLISTAQGSLEREWAQGIIGIEEYAKRLQRLNVDAINADFGPQQDALREEIQKARREGADPAYIQALREQINALGDAWREALTNGTHEAREAIAQILGTSVSSVQDMFRGAFDTDTFDGFLDTFGDNLLSTTRNALITAFLESAVIKPLMDELSNAITDAVIDGMITDAELEGILSLGDEIGQEMEWFFNLLDRMGLGFDGLNDNINALNDSMRNVPTVFRATQAAMDSVNASAPRYVPQAAPPQGYAGQNYTLGTNPVPMDGRPIVYITGDVYGFEDFEQKVQVAVSTGDERRNASSYGRS